MEHIVRVVFTSADGTQTTVFLPADPDDEAQASARTAAEIETLRAMALQQAAFDPTLWQNLDTHLRNEHGIDVAEFNW